MTVANETQRPGQAGLIGSDWAGAIAAGLALAFMLVFYWDGFVAMVQSWTRPEYSFGPLVPLVSAYMLLHEIRRRPPMADGGSRWPGVVMIGFGLATGYIGNLSQIPYLIAYGFIISIGGLALVLAGIRQGLRYWPGWIHLLFMLPLPNFLYWHLSGYLQRLSSKIGVEVIYAMGIPVYLDGNIIDLGVYKLQVAEACNGLRYLFPLMSFGYLFAVLYRGPLWQKLLLFFLTIPITILMNSFRIGVIGILVNSFGIGQAEGFLHLFEGWIIFVSCVVILYLFGLLLQRLRRQPETAFNILDLDFNGLLKPLAAVRTFRITPALASSVAMIVVIGSMWTFIPAKSPEQVRRESLTAFPSSLGDWSGKRRTLDELTFKVLGADEYLLADFASPKDSRGINLFVAYYNSTSDGTGIHSPEICIPGSGWEVFRWDQIEVSPENGISSFDVNRAVIQKGQHRQLVYYWFEQRGRRLAGEVETKLYTVYDSAVRGRADGALVRLTTPLAPGEAEAVGDKRLQQFLAPTLAVFPAFIPN
jgi:exosortase D (VPLPA-CTERM-specific)